MKRTTWHRCPIEGCQEQVPFERLMCPRHWHKLRTSDNALALRVIETWSGGGGHMSEAHRVACQAAIAAVNGGTPSRQAFDFENAYLVGHAFRTTIGQACTRVELAGSLRRLAAARALGLPLKHPFVKDVEIVCQPKAGNDKRLLFGDGACCALDLRLAELFDAGSVTLDPQNKKNGPRYKRLVYEGLPVDLFVVRPPASWGATLVIRTGDADFSKTIVTPRDWGGAMPDDLRMHAGGICRTANHRGSADGPCSSACRIPTDTEEALFQALGLPMINAAERDLRHLRGLLSRRK